MVPWVTKEQSPSENGGSVSVAASQVRLRVALRARSSAVPPRACLTRLTLFGSSGLVHDGVVHEDAKPGRRSDPPAQLRHGSANSKSTLCYRSAAQAARKRTKRMTDGEENRVQLQRGNGQMRESRC